MTELLETLKNYWPQILGLLAALHALLGAINDFIPHDKVPAWFSFLLDHLGALPKKGMEGRMGWYSPPFAGSREKGESKDA